MLQDGRSPVRVPDEVNWSTPLRTNLNQYDFSNLSDHQFINQSILYLLTPLYTFHYIQCLMDIVVNYLLQSLLYLFYLNLGPAC
jgi:hypothetical protein